jgi:hypothetical protein
MYFLYMIRNHFAGIYSGMLPDARLEKRVEKTMLALYNAGSAVTNKCCKTLAEKEGAYRMLDNDRFDHNDLTEGAIRRLRKNVKGGHYLDIQDTSEFNVTSHMGRIGREDKDIGPVTKEYADKEKTNAGFFCHPSLVIDASTQMPVGFSSIILWNRPWDKKNRHEREYKKQDITEKESYRWIESAFKTKESLSEADTITIIADRESDIYEIFSTVPDSRTHLLIRANVDRMLTEGIKLKQKLSSSPVRAGYEFDVPAGKNRKKHTAKMSLKWEKIKICHPVNKPKKNGYPAFVGVTVIEATELPGSVNPGEDPVSWTLLTTHSVKKAADALQCIEWFAVQISEGGLHWLLNRLASKGASAYEMIRQNVLHSRVIGTDETGVKINGKSIGSGTIEQNMSGISGEAVLVHDCWKAHFQTPVKKHQLCTAHLERETKYLEERYKVTWPIRFRVMLREAQKLKKQFSPADYYYPNQVLSGLEKELDELLSEPLDPKHKELISFQKRIIKYRDHVFPFLYHPDVPPDNNGSERAIRNVKVKQKVSGQFKILSAAENFAILRSIIDTAIKNNRNVVAALNVIADHRTD